MKKHLALIMLTTLMLGGCAWVDLTPDGELVRKVDLSEAAPCKKIGETTVSVLARVIGINRGKKKVAGELLTLARNSAAEMGGNTLVPISEISNGEQTFAVYRCTSH